MDYLAAIVIAQTFRDQRAVAGLGFPSTQNTVVSVSLGISATS